MRSLTLFGLLATTWAVAARSPQHVGFGKKVPERAPRNAPRAQLEQPSDMPFDKRAPNAKAKSSLLTKLEHFMS